MGIWHVSVLRSRNTGLQIGKLRNTTPAVLAPPPVRNSSRYIYISLRGSDPVANHYSGLAKKC